MENIPKYGQKNNRIVHAFVMFFFLLSFLFFLNLGMTHDHGMGILCMRLRFYLEHNTWPVRHRVFLSEYQYCSQSVALLIIPVMAVFTQAMGSIQSNLVIQKGTGMREIYIPNNGTW